MKKISLSICLIILITANRNIFSSHHVHAVSSNAQIILEVSDSAPPAPESTTTCSDQTPTKVPWLYGAITQDSSSVLLYFTEAGSPVDKYTLEYGISSGHYQYTIQDMGVNAASQMTYLVKSLSPSTAYFFRVRGSNGCAAGVWSNEISAKTKGLVSLNQLAITESELKLQPTVNQISTSETETVPQQVIRGYDVTIKVVDTMQKPVEGAKVTIYSRVQQALTDNNGLARFSNIEPGEHKVIIAYGRYQGEQSINLTGTVKEFDLNVTVEPKEITLSPLVYIVIGVMILIILRKKQLKI